MIKPVAVAALLLLAPAALAQDNSVQDALEEALGETLEITGQDAIQQKVVQGTGAFLRGLDKVDGHIVDMTLSNGMTAEVGRLSVELQECRYPADDSVTDAYALMTIRDIATSKVLFSGWMLASSPALNALEHPRYDVWVLRCKTE
jgi:hypothetical protein